MDFNTLLANIQKIYPDVNVQYKDQSTFMQILGKILFFNPSFMTDFTTTVGTTIYYPSQEWVNNNIYSAEVLMLHELTHIYDQKNSNSILYALLYVLPQLLFILFIPLLFVINWKFALIPLVFLAPIPSYFRMYYERRAYTISMYATQKLGCIQTAVPAYVADFTSSEYYFMWPFTSSLTTYFTTVQNQIINNQRPSNPEPAVYDLVDQILSQ
jgi:ABC-type multidrug transport system fused ATPase/permease subunit